MSEGIAGAAGAGPAQASLGRGWRGPLFCFFDLQQDLEIRKKVEKVESASLLTSTVEEEQRKGKKSKDPKAKMRKGHLLFHFKRYSWEHHLYVIGGNDFHVFPTALQCHGWGMTEGLSVKSHRM